MIISPIARPSRPSVRFTEFDDPAITSTRNKKKNDERQRIGPGIVEQAAISRSGLNCLKNGTLIAVSNTARCACSDQQHHADDQQRPSTCSPNFCRAVRPRLRFLRTFV